MTDNGDLDVLDVLQDILATDRTFYGIVRFLDGARRSEIIAAHLRNTNLSLALIHRYMTAPQSLVINFPLNMDLSGNSFFDPIPVIPTPAQILAATEVNIPMPAESTCSICQENMNNATRIRACGHCFHQECISQWLSMNVRCPMCRHDVRTLLVNSTLTTSNEDGGMHTDS
jgi:hypothetical protein